MRKCLGLVLALVLLAGTATASAAEVLTIWGRRAYVEEAFDAFEAQMRAQGREVELQLTQVSSTDMTSKLLSAFAAGEAPDLVMLDSILGPYFVAEGAFEDLTDLYRSMPYRDEFSEGMLRMGAYQGRQYLLPLFSDNSALMYNRALFAAAGLDPDRPPTTWDEFTAAAKALTRDTDGDGTVDVYGVAFAINEADMNMFTFLPFVWANGGDLLNEDGTAPRIHEPEAVEALQYWVDLIHTHKVTPPGTTSYGYTDVYMGFATGKIAMIIGGDWMIGTLSQDAPDLDYGIAYIPRPAGGRFSSFAGGDLIGITSTSKNKDLARAFVEFAMSEAVQVEVWAKHGAIPVRTSFYDNPYFRAEPRYAPFTATLDVAQAPVTPKYNELYDPMLEAIQRATMGLVTPQEAFDRAAQRIQQILNRR